MSISFEQLLEMLQSPDCPVDRLRYCNLTSDIIHVVCYVRNPETGFGEAFLTEAQLNELKVRFPGVSITMTGTFPLPPKK